MLTTEFLITSLVVVLIPGTGVIYTISTGLFIGGRASIAAAVGCNRPYANSLPGPSIRNFPFPPNDDDLDRVHSELWARGAGPGESR